MHAQFASVLLQQLAELTLVCADHAHGSSLRGARTDNQPLIYHSPLMATATRWLRTLAVSATISTKIGSPFLRACHLTFAGTALLRVVR
jgi:hypothetical protein